MTNQKENNYLDTIKEKNNSIDQYESTIQKASQLIDQVKAENVAVQSELNTKTEQNSILNNYLAKLVKSVLQDTQTTKATKELANKISTDLNLERVIINDNN